MDKSKNRQYIEKTIAKARLAIGGGVPPATDENPMLEIYKDYRYSLDEEDKQVYSFEYTADYNYIDRHKEEVKNSSNIHSKYSSVIVQRLFDLQQNRINSLEVTSQERQEREKSYTLSYHLEPVKNLLDSKWKALALNINESATIYSTLILSSILSLADNKFRLSSDYKSSAIFIVSTPQEDRFFVGLQECSGPHFLEFLSSKPSLSPILEAFTPIVEKLRLDKEIKESTRTPIQSNKI